MIHELMMLLPSSIGVSRGEGWRNFNEMQRRFSGNAPPAVWPATYSSILDSDRFAIELVLTAANQNNCHMAAEMIAILRLTTTVASSSCSRQSCVQKTAWNRARFKAAYHLHIIKIPSHLSVGNSCMQVKKWLVLLSWAGIINLLVHTRITRYEN